MSQALDFFELYLSTGYVYLLGILLCIVVFTYLYLWLLIVVEELWHDVKHKESINIVATNDDVSWDFNSYSLTGDLSVAHLYILYEDQVDESNRV